jgi:hypothetical protein
LPPDELQGRIARGEEDEMNDRMVRTLQRFADGLTPEERAELRAMRTDDVAGLRSSSLWDKARQVADDLAPEDLEMLRRLLADAGVVAAIDDEADTTGYRESLYDGAGEQYLWKGPPGTSPYDRPNAGGSIGGAAVLFLTFLTGVMGPIMLINDPSLGQP